MTSASTGFSSVELPAQVEFVNADLFEAAHLQRLADPQLRSQEARQWADTCARDGQPGQGCA